MELERPKEKHSERIVQSPFCYCIEGIFSIDVIIVITEKSVNFYRIERRRFQRERKSMS